MLQDYLEYAYKYRQKYFRADGDFFDDFVLERIWVTLHPESYDEEYIDHIVNKVDYPDV